MKSVSCLLVGMLAASLVYAERFPTAFEQRHHAKYGVYPHNIGSATNKAAQEPEAAPAQTFRHVKYGVRDTIMSVVRHNARAHNTARSATEERLREKYGMTPAATEHAVTESCSAPNQ